jgi:transcription initiation factor TFIID subunit 12
MATTGASTAQPTANAASIITAIGNAFKSQTGDPMSGDRIAQLLLANMGQLGELAKQGKLNQSQILQVKSLCAVERFHYQRQTISSGSTPTNTKPPLLP